jgi:hypothetical protein
MANCTVTADTNTDALAAPVFCQNLIANCTSLPTAYSTQALCEAAYTLSTKQHCQSYHLCWGVEGKDNTAGPNPTTHCPHAEGMGPCAP